MNRILALAVVITLAIIATAASPAKTTAAPTEKIAAASITTPIAPQVEPQVKYPHNAILASVTSAKHRLARRLRAYYWAAKRAGDAYVWGGTGPTSFDCSGLVMMAYRHVGISLPRTTYDMLGSSLLKRVWHPRMGDLAFYGSGHVELFRKWGWTFGAHDYGSPVGLIHYGFGWVPTAFYRVV